MKCKLIKQKLSLIISLSALFIFAILLAMPASATYNNRYHPEGFFNEGPRALHRIIYESNRGPRCNSCHKKESSYEKGDRRFHPLDCIDCHHTTESMFKSDN